MLEPDHLAQSPERRLTRGPRRGRADRLGAARDQPDPGRATGLARERLNDGQCGAAAAPLRGVQLLGRQLRIRRRVEAAEMDHAAQRRGVRSRLAEQPPDVSWLRRVDLPAARPDRYEGRAWRDQMAGLATRAQQAR